jgi:HAD superfamily hydrolase (TIGR01509 family)
MVDNTHPKQSWNAQNNDIKVVVYDLDNTLVLTDEANNYSYIEVLGRFGYDTSRLKSTTRITSTSIQISYPEIARFKLWRIRRNKLKVFLNNLHLVHLNDMVIATIEEYKNLAVIIWTSSNRKRALTQIKHFNIYCDWILFSPKDTAATIEKIVAKIEKKYRVERRQIVFFDDDAKTISLLGKAGVLTIQV